MLAPPAYRQGMRPCLAAVRPSARSSRAIERSRPSAASDSKIPGETVVPVIATRIGW